MKFAGPTKKMMQALEDEGLNIRWPDTGTVKDDNTLAIEGSFYTGTAGQYEKLVLIDLRNEGDLSTKSKVDAAIWNQLDLAYDNFSVDEEMQLNMEGTAEERLARGVPSAEKLLEDMKEQERRLKRFSDVAGAVYSGREIPAEEGEEKVVTLTAEMAEMVKEIMAGAVPHLTDRNIERVNEIIHEINRQLEG